MNREVTLLEYQYQALNLNGETPEILVSGGIGSGKSQLGAIWIVDKIAYYPKASFLIAACTYSQLMNASVKTLIILLDELEIPCKAVLSGARKRIEIGQSTIYLYSLDKPDTIRGIEVSFAWLDEVAFSDLEALNVVRGRMRGKHSDYRQILMTSSPNGYNFLYDIFGKLNIQATRKKLISVKTKDNVFLPEDYYENLVEQYGGEDTPLARQELFGEFVNLQEGGIYNLFDRKINVKKCELNKKYPVYVGMDFNIEVMSAVYCQFIDGQILVCKEVQLNHRDANTLDMSNHINKELVSKGFNVQVIPDSTGKARKTSSSSGQTDHQILREAGLRVLESSNPFIRDRQQSLNVAFKKQKVMIDPSCGQLIKDIETLSSRDKEGSVSHLGPSLGYVVWYLMPIKPIAPKSKQLYI